MHCVVTSSRNASGYCDELQCKMHAEVDKFGCLETLLDDIRACLTSSAEHPIKRSFSSGLESNLSPINTNNMCSMCVKCSICLYEKCSTCNI